MLRGLLVRSWKKNPMYTSRFQLAQSFSIRVYLLALSLMCVRCVVYRVKIIKTECCLVALGLFTETELTSAPHPFILEQIKDLIAALNNQTLVVAQQRWLLWQM